MDGCIRKYVCMYVCMYACACVGMYVPDVPMHVCTCVDICR